MRRRVFHLMRNQLRLALHHRSVTAFCHLSYNMHTIIPTIMRNCVRRRMFYMVLLVCLCTFVLGKFRTKITTMHTIYKVVQI